MIVLSLSASHQPGKAADPLRHPLSCEFWKRYVSFSIIQAPDADADLLCSSVDVGLVHVVVLCNYLAFGSGSDQYSWFQYDMTNNLNRAVTPWILIMFHAPV